MEIKVEKKKKYLKPHLDSSHRDFTIYVILVGRMSLATTEAKKELKYK
jgi:hypothetical protein